MLDNMQVRLQLDQVTVTTCGSEDAEPGTAASDALLRSPNDTKHKDTYCLLAMSNCSVSSDLKPSLCVSSNNAYAASDVNNEMKTEHKLLESDLEACTQEAETKLRALELTAQSLEKHGMPASLRQINNSVIAVDRVSYLTMNLLVKPLDSRKGQLDSDVVDVVEIVGEERWIIRTGCWLVWQQIECDIWRCNCTEVEIGRAHV